MARLLERMKAMFVREMHSRLTLTLRLYITSLKCILKKEKRTLEVLSIKTPFQLDSQVH